MGLEYTSGRFQWASTDTAGATKVISGLAFQPKAIKFWTNGVNAATSFTNFSTYFWSMGFANSTTSRCCITGYSANNVANSRCTREANTLAILTSSNGTTTQDGGLDLSAIASGGFTVIVRNQTSATCTVHWEAWGGTDIESTSVGMLVSSLVDQDVTSHTAVGFDPSSAGIYAANDQVVMLVIGNAVANNTVTRENGGIAVGFATKSRGIGSYNPENQIVAGTSVGNNYATSSTTGFGGSNVCYSMASDLDPVASGTTGAYVEDFGTNNFTLFWGPDTLNHRVAYMTIKGGSWRSGDYLHNGSAASNTVTISGLPFQPKGIEFITAGRTGSTYDGLALTATSNATLSYGWANSTTQRSCMSIHDRNGQATMQCRATMNVDAVLSYSRSPGVLQRFNLNSITSNGFSTIVDSVGQGVANQWVGYLAFGDAPITAMGYSFGQIY